MTISRRFTILVWLIIVLLKIDGRVNGQEAGPKPEPKAIAVNMEGKEYVRLLGGPPESILMRAGAVALQPGKTVGKHNTESYEELVVVLEGQGEMLLKDGKTLGMRIGTVLYCPPDTEHDVKNTGSSVLRYIYVVAKTK